MSLSVEQILAAADNRVREVKVPEWGGSVFVRTISADERDRFEARFADRKDKGGVRADLVGMALCDEQGKALKPTDAEIKALGQKSSGVMDRIFSAIMDLNMMNARDVEKLEGNSDGTAEPACG
jgi:hypothetical protein